MISHVTLGITDFDRALAFYDGLARILGLRPRFCDAAVPWAAWQPADATRPLLIITAPVDGRPARPGNGTMTAFSAPDRATVRAAHDHALAAGGTSEGGPGLRPDYHADYYGAYFRDPDGNKLCVVCHRPEADR